MSTPLADLVRQLGAAGCSVEQIAVAVEHQEQQLLAATRRRSEKNAARQARYRSRNNVTRRNATAQDVPERDPPQHILPPQENSEPKRVLRSMRGTRLSVDWVPDTNDQTFAVEQGFSQPEIITMASDFRDYWHARAGPGGLKNDWKATWRRWVRTAAEKRKNGQRAYKTGAYSASGPAQNGADAILAGMANVARKRGLLEPADQSQDREFQRPLDLTGRADAD